MARKPYAAALVVALLAACNPDAKPSPVRPTPEEIHPGSFCSSADAEGTATGRTYRCSGDPLRWTREDDHG